MTLWNVGTLERPTAQRTRLDPYNATPNELDATRRNDPTGTPYPQRSNVPPFQHATPFFPNASDHPDAVPVILSPTQHFGSSGLLAGLPRKSDNARNYESRPDDSVPTNLFPGDVVDYRLPNKAANDPDDQQRDRY